MIHISIFLTLKKLEYPKHKHEKNMQTQKKVLAVIKPNKAFLWDNSANDCTMTLITDLIDFSKYMSNYKT